MGATHRLLLSFGLALVSASALFPPGASAQSRDKINADRDGIANNAGRTSAYKPAPPGYDVTMVRKWADAHRAAKGNGYRYVYVPESEAASAESANVLRVAAGKAWNHLSWKPEIDIPEDVSDGAGLVFAISPEKLWGANANQNWNFVANCTPKRNIFVSPAPRGDCQGFPVDQPVAIPRFVYNATNGGPYANVHQTPPSFDRFTQKFPMSSITHTSTHKEAIVCGPRITAYRTVKYQGQDLLYSYTSDEFDGRDRGEISYKSSPTDRDQRQTGSLNAGPGDGRTAVASEWWIQLPNGFLYYSIHGEGSQERGKAEFPFAVDPANWKQQATLATGRSCITCHANGIQSAPSDDQFEGKDGWSSNAELTALYEKSRLKFQTAMRALVDGLSDGPAELNERIVKGTVEPVTKAIRIVEGPFQGQNYGCESFCQGKFGSQRRNLCDTMPTR